MHAIMPSRTQLTLRVPEHLARDLKRVAAERGLSVNAFADQALRAAVDPDASGSEIERLRERLARAGVLATHPPSTRPRPSGEDFEKARHAAGKGVSASQLISRDREERGF
jgi:HicB family